MKFYDWKKLTTDSITIQMANLETPSKIKKIANLLDIKPFELEDNLNLPKQDLNYENIFYLYLFKRFIQFPEIKTQIIILLLQNISKYLKELLGLRINFLNLIKLKLLRRLKKVVGKLHNILNWKKSSLYGLKT